jgi:hypothetical protein
VSAADDYCRLAPSPSDRYGDPCRACGHVGIAHVGVDHCPVCELVALAEQQRNQLKQDAPVKAETLPKVGETVHVWRPNDVLGGCAPLRVAGQHATAPGVDTILVLDGPLPWTDRIKQYLTQIHDETRIAPGSWHWPCSSNCQNAEPEPEPPAPAVIRIDLHGTCVASKADIDRLATDVGNAVLKRLSTGTRIQP